MMLHLCTHKYEVKTPCTFWVRVYKAMGSTLHHLLIHSLMLLESNEQCINALITKSINFVRNTWKSYLLWTFKKFHIWYLTYDTHNIVLILMTSHPDTMTGDLTIAAFTFSSQRLAQICYIGPLHKVKYL